MNWQVISAFPLVKFYIISAQGYTMTGNTDKALEILEKYAELVTGDIYPLKIKGDDYFNLLEEWIEMLDFCLVVCLLPQVAAAECLASIPPKIRKSCIKSQA